MGRARSAENATDPATGRPMPPGVRYIGEAQYRARKLINGKRVSSTFETAKAAAGWLQEQIVDIRRGTYVDRTTRLMTVREMVDRFESEEMAVGGDRRGAAEDRGHTPALRGDKLLAPIRLDQLTPDHCAAFQRRQLDAGFAKATVVKRMNLLARMISHARQTWKLPMLGENPASGRVVPRPKGADKKRTRVLINPAEFAHLPELPPGFEMKPEREILLEVLAASGQPLYRELTELCIVQATRQGEALGLRWRDVDFYRQHLEIHGRIIAGRDPRRGAGTKNEDHRDEVGPEIRALMPAAAGILRKLRPADYDPDAFVFPIRQNVHAFRIRWRRIVQQAAQRLDPIYRELRYLEALRFHDLRHHATTEMKKVFPDPLDLMRVTGHLDIKSLNRYNHPSPASLVERATAYEAERMRRGDSLAQDV